LLPVFANKKLSPLTLTNAVTETGIGLMTTFLLPFELAGILLLIALIGAALISGSKPTQKR
jgi:NADH-quinone oxidoreductase subunit J